MYTGAWADEFVRIVGREGGKVVKADLADYRPIWSDPVSTSYAGTTVYAPGGDALAWALFVPLLNLAEVTGLNQKQPFWRDAHSFRSEARRVGKECVHTCRYR